MLIDHDEANQILLWKLYYDGHPQSALSEDVRTLPSKLLVNPFLQRGNAPVTLQQVELRIIADLAGVRPA